VLKRIGLRVVTDPVAQPHAERGIRCRIPRLVDLVVAVERLEEAVAQLRKLGVEIDEGHLRLAELGDRTLLTVRGSGYLNIIPCGGRFVFRQHRGASCCAGALLADIAQRWLNPDRRGI
jgi:hypothetical protein